MDGRTADELVPAAAAFCRPMDQEPQRAYHTLGHVQAMLGALEQRSVLTPVLALAMWGHDLRQVEQHDIHGQGTMVLWNRGGKGS